MGKSSEQKIKNTYMPGQKAAYQSLLGSSMGQVDYGRMLQPYTGQYTVPYSSGEKWGQDYMKNLLTSDPSQSPYYRALRNQAYENQDKALTGVRQSAAEHTIKVQWMRSVSGTASQNGATYKRILTVLEIPD